MTQIDNWEKEWEQHPALKEVIDTAIFCAMHGREPYKGELITEFFRKQITLAKTEERKRVLKLIKKYSPTCGGGKCYVVEELINKLK